MRDLRLLASVFSLVSAPLVPADLLAQATTNAAVRGVVVDTAGTPVADATVLSINLSNGERWQTTSDSHGRYYLAHLSVGGPYRLEVRAIGFQPASRGEFSLSLGQQYQSDFALVPGAFRLEEIMVAADADPRINPGRTGPAQIIPRETISRLPIPDRDFSTLALLSPQVTVSPNGGLSFAGQHERFNSLQVDGSTNNDLLTCSCGGIGTPLGLRAFSPEAVQEIQVITAPFDVRYGNFAGGLVNAVTKSGSNRFEGSLFSYLETAGLTGHDSAGNRASAFNNKEAEFLLGGPVVHDRLAFFVDAGYRRHRIPQEVPAPTSDTTGGADSAGVGIRYATLTRFQNLLRDSYGVEPGGFAFATARSPSWSLFAKLTVQLGVNSRLALSHDHPHATFEDEGFRGRGFYQLSSGGITDPNTSDATRLTWTTAFARPFSNELIMARLDASQRCVPASAFPMVEVSEHDATLLAGSTGYCLGQTSEQEIWELTDNMSAAAGAHRLTFGTHGELINLHDAGLSVALGHWQFASLDSLEQGLPSGYERDVPNPSRPSDLVNFGVRQIGFYAQDEWSPRPHLTLTAGLRFDVPFFRGAPIRNPALATELGIDNRLTPSGNVLWSPRLGINWDVSGHATTFLRGGVGLFSGRPPYFWVAEVYRRTGLGSVHLNCFDADVPAFTLDSANQPATCANFEPPVPRVGYFDPSFRFPRNLKFSLGADQRLPWGVIGTVDLLYTRWLNQIEWVDRNLAGPVGVAAGEGGRVMYGTVDPDFGFGIPNRLSDAFDAVIQLRNASGDRSWSLTEQLQKRFASGTELSLAYTWTDAKNRNDAPADFLFSNYAFSTVDGSVEGRPLRPSIWSDPHKVTLLATANLPLKFQLGLMYVGASGRPFTWRVDGDGNADGVGGNPRDNDPAYVPRDSSDITLNDPAEWPILDSIIQSDKCLSRQRGRLVERNSCRSPWINDTRARLTTVLPLAHGQSLQFSADLFNLLNFLDSDWGHVRQEVQDFGVAPLLGLVGYDEVRGRGVYAVEGDDRRELDQGRSRWRVQLSARYVF
jgi:Carboxypeptidase regulatory-like domain